MMRRLLRQLLAILTKLTIRKHRPQIVAIVGDGHNSLLREMLFAAVNAERPARRNLEKPEAEFSVPLTILGYNRYPMSYKSWVKVIISAIWALFRNKSFTHTVLVEMTSISEQIRDYWLKILEPELIVDSSQCKSMCWRNHEIFNQVENSVAAMLPLALQVTSKLGLDQDISQEMMNSISLPKARVKTLVGRHGGLLIDSRYYYYPPSLSVIAELVPPDTLQVIFINNLEKRLDVSGLKQLLDLDVLQNPSGYSPTPDDVVVVYGERSRTNELQREILPLEYVSHK